MLLGVVGPDASVQTQGLGDAAICDVAWPMLHNQRYTEAVEIPSV